MSAIESADSTAASPQAEVCQACGKRFECNPGGSCWCMTESVSERALAELRARYERCLCAACLRKAAETDR